MKFPAHWSRLQRLEAAVRRLRARQLILSRLEKEDPEAADRLVEKMLRDPGIMGNVFRTAFRFGVVEARTMYELERLASKAFRRREIVRPPGLLIDRFARFIFKKKTYERVFQPIIVDMRLEYFESLSEGRRWHARWVSLRDHLGFCKALLALIPVSITRLFVKIWTTAG